MTNTMSVADSQMESQSGPNILESLVLRLRTVIANITGQEAPVYTPKERVKPLTADQVDANARALDEANDRRLRGEQLKWLADQHLAKNKRVAPKKKVA